ncbi:MAG: helix-turn-helix domain-containing protein [Natronosporangium sp.]
MPEMTFGERLRAHRERAGKTRAVLGGLVGRSEEWVKAVESNRLHMPRLPILIRLAEALGIDDLAELTGSSAIEVRRVAYGEHPTVPAIRDAVQRYPLTRPDRPVPHEAGLRSRVDRAWTLWHGSRTRRSDVGALLPALLRDCQDRALTSDGESRRSSHRVLADAYHLAQHALVNAADPDLLWLIVERAMAAARIADEPLTLAGAAWTVGMMLRGAGRMEEAEVLIQEGAGLLEPRLADAPDDWRGMWGALQLHGALTAARAGNDGVAWAYWDRASQAARSLPAGYAHPWTMFGQANVELTAVSLTVDLWKSREALRRAELIDPDSIPSRERRGRLFVEMARGHHATNQKVAATRLLLAACDQGVDAVRYSPAARAIIDDLQAAPPRAIRQDVLTLASRVGLDPA